MPRSPQTFEERFWSKVDRSGSCWLWAASLQKGYGQINRDGRPVRANRVAWELTFGPIPMGQHVLHRCDDPRCVKPAHLFLGTQATNMKDKVAKGRSGFKLTVERVQQIRARLALGESHRAIARVFGVDRSNIGFIANNKIWRIP